MVLNTNSMSASVNSRLAMIRRLGSGQFTSAASKYAELAKANPCSIH